MRNIDRILLLIANPYGIMKKSVSLTYEEEEIIKGWVCSLIRTTPKKKIHKMTYEEIYTKGFELTIKSLSRITEKKNEAQEYIRNLYF